MVYFIFYLGFHPVATPPPRLPDTPTSASIDACLPSPGSKTPVGEYDAVVIRYDADLEEEDITQIGSEGEDLVMALTGNDDIQGDIVIVGSTQSESLTQEHMFPDFQVNGSEFIVLRCTPL